MKSKIELIVNGKIELSETMEVSSRFFAQKAHIATLRFALLAAMDSIEKTKIESNEERED